MYGTGNHRMKGTRIRPYKTMIGTFEATITTTKETIKGWKLNYITQKDENSSVNEKLVQRYRNKIWQLK